MAKRKPRLQGKPSWVIASLAGALAWGIVTVVAVVFFEVALTSAVIFGLVVFAVVAAPVIVAESAAVAMAVFLEFSFGAIAFVIFAPLALLGSCG